mmetsp:Transcript_61577/g.149025  ORF Transcript_61577/g.149025 Transcript_61577/m.149025 type:complete len:344 (-) Transcript_61577:97-1128(-)
MDGRLENKLQEIKSLPGDGRLSYRPTSKVGSLMGFRAEQMEPAATAVSYSSTCKYMPVSPLSTIVRKPSLTLSAVRTPLRPGGFGNVAVSTMPGEMEFTRTPVPRSSSAKVAVRPSTANLEAQYGAALAIPILPAREDTLTMSPRPVFSMAWRSTALVTMRTLTTFRSNSLLKSLGNCSCKGPLPVVPPALLISRSIPPSSATTADTAVATSASFVTSAWTESTLEPNLNAASSFTACSSAFVLDRMATSAPSSAHSNAIAFPMPRPPPVIRARRPASRLISRLCAMQDGGLLPIHRTPDSRGAQPDNMRASAPSAHWQCEEQLAPPRGSRRPALTDTGPCGA